MYIENGIAYAGTPTDEMAEDLEDTEGGDE